MNQFKNDKELLTALDEFIHKSKSLRSEIRTDLILHINKFLERRGLDKDPHNFVDTKSMK